MGVGEGVFVGVAVGVAVAVGATVALGVGSTSAAGAQAIRSVIERRRRIVVFRIGIIFIVVLTSKPDCTRSGTRCELEVVNGKNGIS